MDNYTQTNLENKPQIHFGHFSLILVTFILLAGFTYMQKPGMFKFSQNQNILSKQEVPKYYAYVPENIPAPLVAGANTSDGPIIINEDGTLSPVDLGQVLGASTQQVQLSLDEIKVKIISDSNENIYKYLDELKVVMNGPIDNAEFETALTSSNQVLINAQADKLVLIKNQISALPVPQSLTRLAKLTIIQYESAIGVLRNFTQADENPELVGQYLQAFLKSQQDLDSENNLVADKYNLSDNVIIRSDITAETNQSEINYPLNTNGQ